MNYLITDFILMLDISPAVTNPVTAAFSTGY